MKLCIMTVLVLCAAFLVLKADASEIGFIEDFSLSDKREEVLKQLIPGTSEYYFFHCLNAQHKGDHKEVLRLLDLWIKREGYTVQVKEILNRQALLEYQENPEKSLEHIRNELGLRFNHTRESSKLQADIPNTLDPDIISIHVLTQEAFSKYQNLHGIEDTGLDILNPEQLNPDRRRDMLQRLHVPDFPNLAKLVTDDLKYKHSSGFGSLNIHRILLKSQMDECVKIMPDLLDNPFFVSTYISRLAPSNDTDISYNPHEKKAWLERMWKFAEDLSPVHNSLKAHILYHILDMNRRQGNYDNDLFMKYIRLPKNAHYINPDYIQTRELRHYQADLNADFSGATTMKSVGSDEELVQDYLSNFFIKDKDYNIYMKYMRENWLKKIFAETKILNNLGDMEQWYSMTGPENYRILKDRVDIDFALTNKEFFTVEDTVNLDLYVKNVETLIVKAYELNTLNYYQINLEEIDTAINLDGLKAAWEKVIKYDEAPQRRIKRTFDFPYIDKPGVFVLEFIGNGKNSRAIIRKGKLHFISRITAAGHEFAVLDEKNQKRPGAVIHMAGREYKPDEQGLITIPFTASAGFQAVILQDRDFCSIASFNHMEENYTLSAGFHLDRESLIAGEKAKLVIRPDLRLNAFPVSLSLLENVRLEIESRDHEGVSAAKEIPDFELFEDKESVFEFQVPENMAYISFSLKGKVKNISRNKAENMEAVREFTINGIDNTMFVRDMFLTHVNENYIIEVLGKNGEPAPECPVQIELKHRFFRDKVNVSLKSDQKGRVYLGSLEGIEQIEAGLSEGISHTWNPDKNQCNYHEYINNQEGTPVFIPWGNSSAEPRIDYTLLEKRGNVWTEDKSDSVILKDGFLEIKGLKPGDYDIFFKQDKKKTSIRITQGESSSDFLISSHRILEINETDPLYISDVDAGEKFLTIKLGNVSETSRVHVTAACFMPDFKIFDNLIMTGLPHPDEIRLSRPESKYIPGRNIGDEYRYILDRKYADKFPGNMLNQPELLLNPWSIRKTETSLDKASDGEDFSSDIKDLSAWGAMAPSMRISFEKAQSFSNLDFLAEPSVLLLNLKPDENGVVKIDRKDLGEHHQIHIAALDQFNTIYREISLQEAETGRKDQRMARSLDPDMHFTEQKQISLVLPGQSFAIEDMSSSEFEIYDSLSKIYRLMASLNRDKRLEEFSFILTWTEMKEEEKKKKYSEYACHELNFFIYHKDRPFFDNVILPFIKNKKDKTFLDLWLTGENLDKYLEPFAFSQLNILEKILLFRGTAREENPIIPYVGELNDMIPPDIDTYNRLFDTALKGMSLEEDSFAAKEEISIQRSEMEADEVLTDRMSKSARVRMSHAPAMMAEAAPAPSSPMIMGRRDMKKDMEKREKIRPFFQKPDKTQEWAENNYYKLPIESQNADLITVNCFWNDFAQSDNEKPFFSTNFQYASRNFTEMMMALSILELPFVPGKHETDIRNGAFSLKPQSPLIIFHKQIQQAEPAKEKTPVLVSQNFFRPDDRYRYEGNERYDKFIQDEFLFRIPFGSQIVLSNPTSSPQKMRMLVQIPNGAMPLTNGFYTKGIPVTLDPYAAKTFEYYFYFPETGDFPCYPVQIAKNEEFIASVSPMNFHVVQELTKIDTESWEYVSQNGTDEAVIDFIEKSNINRLDLNKIAFRMKDREFFIKIMALLKNRLVFHQTLWSYSLFHNIPENIRQYLEHTSYADHCGMVIDTPLLTLNPADRKIYQHLEYKPLINARSHQLGKERKILNTRFYEQYQNFMKKLSWQPELSHEDRLAAVYYLLLQSRISEALEFFKQVDSGKIKSRIQYDYVQIYLDFYMENKESARASARKYAELESLVPHWRSRFQLALAHLDEIEGRQTAIVDEDNRNQAMEKLAETEPSFDFTVESRVIAVNYRNLKSCRINYYPMDIELLFSRNPFVRQQTEHFAFIRPNYFDEIILPEDKNRFTVELPEPFRNSNLMIEITAGALKKSQVYYSNSLDVHVIENYGHLDVSAQETLQPLSRVYVKVYAGMKNGGIQFFKDGYTDLRGRFDYVSLSTDELDNVDKLAILILSEEHGAVIREAVPPKR